MHITLQNETTKTSHNRVLWITRTAALVALLIVLQWVTAGTKVFAGQYITGSCVNAVLVVSALMAGLWSGVTVAILSPFCAYLLGIGPKLIQIVPGVAVGNLVFVLVLYFLIGTEPKAIVRQAIGLLVAAAAKFLTLYLVIVKGIVPALSANLKPQQIAVFSAMFSWPQLVTALIGGVVALLILPLVRKGIQK